MFLGIGRLTWVHSGDLWFIMVCVSEWGADNRKAEPVKVSRGSRWAATLAVLGALAFGASPAAAQEASCHDHEAWDNDGPTGHGASDNAGVQLNPFNKGWAQHHWESITLVGTGGTYSVDHPAAGLYLAQGELLTWTVCKGYDHPVATTTTTVAPTTTAATTTTVTATTTPGSVPVPAETTTTAVVVTPAPEIGLNRALPETGNGAIFTALVALGLTLLGVGTWAAVRRTHDAT